MASSSTQQPRHAPGASGNVDVKMPFAHPMGITKGGVVAYSSDYDTADDSQFKSRRDYISFHEGVYCGFKYQCVEFARRWLVQVHKITFPDVGMAYEIFDLPHFIRLHDESPLPLRRHRNGEAAERPVVGSIIMWRAGGFFKHTGHVAVITEVGDGYIKVAEQNVYDHHWDAANYSRKLLLEHMPATKTWFIHDNHRNTYVLGWVHPADDAYVARSAALE